MAFKSISAKLFIIGTFHLQKNDTLDRYVSHAYNKQPTLQLCETKLSGELRQKLDLNHGKK